MHYVTTAWEEIEGKIKIGMEEVTLSLYADDMILHTENPKDSTHELLQLIKGFSKVAGYKTNIQKSTAFFDINHEIAGKAKKLLLKSHQKLKYLAISLKNEFSKAAG